MADLITIDEYKEYEGITSSKEDERLERLIVSVSQLVKTYCGTTIIDYYTTPKTEEVTLSWDTDVVQLSECPVNTITSVQERDRPESSYVTLDASQYVLDKNTDSLYKIRNNWSKGPASLIIQYTAGYEECPLDLKLAVIDLVKYYLRDEHKERRSMVGATIENQGVTKLRMVGGFPDHIERVLDLYKIIH